MNRAPAWTRRMKYDRNSPRSESGLWALPAVLLILGAWVLAWVALGGAR